MKTQYCGHLHSPLTQNDHYGPIGPGFTLMWAEGHPNVQYEAIKACTTWSVTNQAPPSVSTDHSLSVLSGVSPSQCGVGNTNLWSVYNILEITQGEYQNGTRQ